MSFSATFDRGLLGHDDLGQRGRWLLPREDSVADWVPWGYIPSEDLMQPRSVRIGRGFLWTALILGLVHAFWSFYWAFGGSWMLDTVGQWAVVSQLTQPVQPFFVLLGIGLVKTAAAVIPVAVEYGKLGGRRFWRLISWKGGVGLVIYGGLYAATAMAVLTGLVAAGGDYNKPVMLGHALLWDPLFLFWGLSLVLSLILTRRSATSTD